MTFRLEQVVHERVGAGDVFGIFRDGDQVEEAASTFFRNVVGILDLATGFGSESARLNGRMEFF